MLDVSSNQSLVPKHQITVPPSHQTLLLLDAALKNPLNALLILATKVLVMLRRTSAFSSQAVFLPTLVSNQSVPLMDVFSKKNVHPPLEDALMLNVTLESAQTIPLLDPVPPLILA